MQQEIYPFLFLVQATLSLIVRAEERLYSRYPTPGAACAYSGNGYTGYPLGSAFGNGSYSCVPSYLWAVCASPVYSCPANSTGSSTCTCNTGYVPDPTQTSCVLPACPAHASGTPCACDAGYKFDAAGTSCVSTCPVPDLTAPPFNDACAESLDAGLGEDVSGDCPQLSDDMKNQIQCFADKITATNVTARPPIPYSKATATIRNAAYQAHLREIWDKMIELNIPDNKNNEARRPRQDKVIAEKGCASSGNCDTNKCTAGSHCFAYQPATDSNHSTGTAFDVPKGTINGLLLELTPLPPAPMTPLQQQQAQMYMIAYWLASPTACNLVWGGVEVLATRQGRISYIFSYLKTKGKLP